MDLSLSGSSVYGESPGRNTGVGCHSLLQGIFPTQGLNPDLPHCRWILYRLSHHGGPVPDTEPWIPWSFLGDKSILCSKQGNSCWTSRSLHHGGWSPGGPNPSYKVGTFWTSLVVRWLRIQAPKAGGPGSIPSQGTRSHMWQLRVHMLQLKITQAATKDSTSPPQSWKILHAATKTWHS